MKLKKSDCYRTSYKRKISWGFLLFGECQIIIIFKIINCQTFTAYRDFICFRIIIVPYQGNISVFDSPSTIVFPFRGFLTYLVPILEIELMRAHPLSLSRSDRTWQKDFLLCEHRVRISKSFFLTYPRRDSTHYFYFILYTFHFTLWTLIFALYF